ncbi:MAG TPA: class I SAM-dependent methyltransferase [Gemmatimonadaceae bacterium]
MTTATKPTDGATTEEKARSIEWEDLAPAQLEALAARSRAIGWREALDEVESLRPFFVKRLRNLPLGNWHLLRLLPADSRALDLGCGFGTLALGLADYYRRVVGMDALWSRVSYGALRAREDARATTFAEGSGLALPFRELAFDLVTMNGVLEWAALYAEGAPRALQLRMLAEARRVLAPRGTLAVAIENRFAMETLVGMPDTHTQLRLVPALPRAAAGLVSRVAQRRPYRTFLYDAAGYRRLFRDAGFRNARALDLVSSYNDYDFVVDPGDASTYALLWRRGLVRSFVPRAERARRVLARRWPAALGRLGYAFLVLGGDDVSTVLDAEHPLWARAAREGVDAGRARFACQGATPGSLALVAHDGERLTGAIELSVQPLGDADALLVLPEKTRRALGARVRRVARWTEGPLTIQCHRVTDTQ